MLNRRWRQKQRRGEEVARPSPRAGSLRRCRRLAGAAALAALAPAFAAADDELSTTPYRPSVSTPAALSAPGWIEIEAGLQHNHDGDGAYRDSVPTTIKLAFTPDWGIRVSGESWVWQHDDPTSGNSFGDTSVILKRRFAVDEQQAFGLEAGVTVPTSKHGLGAGSGKTDYGVNAIYSADFAESWHTDLNLATMRLGQVAPGASHLQMIWAAALSRAFSERWGMVGEFSGADERRATDSDQFLLAATCNVSKRLTLDAGMSRSLRSGPPAWSAFTGLTWQAARHFERAAFAPDRSVLVRVAAAVMFAVRSAAMRRGALLVTTRIFMARMHVFGVPLRAKAAPSPPSSARRG